MAISPQGPRATTRREREDEALREMEEGLRADMARDDATPYMRTMSVLGTAVLTVWGLCALAVEKFYVVRNYTTVLAVIALIALDTHIFANDLAATGILGPPNFGTHYWPWMGGYWMVVFIAPSYDAGVHAAVTDAWLTSLIFTLLILAVLRPGRLMPRDAFGGRIRKS